MLGIGPGIGVRLGMPVKVGGGSPAPAAAQWYQPGAYADFDVENSRFMVNGVEYASSAEMLAADPNVTLVPGGSGWNVVYTGPAIDQVTMVVDGVTSATGTPGALEYLGSMDDGGAVTGDEFAYIGRTTSNTMQAGVTTGSVSVATLALSSLPASTAVRAAVRYKANAFTASKNGGNGVEDTAGGLPTTGRFTIGNRYDGARPWGGTINRVTILVTREFTKEQCELMSGTGLLRGMVWGRHNRRLAFTQNGKTYLGGYNMRDNCQYKIVQDAVTRKTLDFYPVTAPNVIPPDDHSNVVSPGQLLPNGKLCAVSAGHDNEAFLRFRRSTNDMPGNFGDEIQISLDYASTVSYAEMWLNGNTLFVMCQTRGNCFWYSFYSTDFGDTWTKGKALFEGVNEGGGGPIQHYAVGSEVNDGVVTIYTMYHAGNLQNKIRRASWDLNTGVLSSAGVPLGSIYDANKDVAIAQILDLELVRTPPVGNSQRLEGVRNDGQAIALGNTTDGWTTCDYVLGLDTGSWAFNTITAGSSFGAPNNPSYIGGVAFAEHPHSGHLLYTASAASGDNLLEQQASVDGVTFTPTTIVNNGAVKTMRPICPKGATTALAVFGQRATEYDDFNDMVVDAHAYAAAA